MRLTLILLITLISISCKAVTEKSVDVPNFTPAPTVVSSPPETVVSDKSATKPGYSESVDELASQTGLKKLRESSLADDDIEVRIWGGFGLSRLQGFILFRKNSSWSASKIGYIKNGRSRAVLIPVAEPERGWHATWQSMLSHKLLTLPDAESINCDGKFLDGFSYVVEIKKGADYRTYRYRNPNARFENRCAEADEIVAIAQIIRNEYRGF